jgi:uncharacterized protein YigE (DUF2233 family)
MSLEPPPKTKTPYQVLAATGAVTLPVLLYVAGYPTLGAALMLSGVLVFVAVIVRSGALSPRWLQRESPKTIGNAARYQLAWALLCAGLAVDTGFVGRPAMKHGMHPRHERMLILILTVVLLLVVGVAQAVECKVQTFETVEFTTCRVNLRRDRLQLYWRDEHGKPYARLTRLRDSLAGQGKTLIFGMNAGIYEEDLSPLGLFVVDSRELRPLNRRLGFGNFYRPPNGVFLVDASGAQVITTEDYATHPPHSRLATQSGPLLVHRGVLTGSPVMNPQSTSKKIRNGGCAPSPDIAVFVLSDAPVTLYAFGKFFLDELGCREALYLDGSISSLYAPEVRREDDGRDLGPMFGVVQ